MLRGYFRLFDADDAATRREKIRARLVALDASIAEALPYLWNLLSIPEAPDPLAQMDAQIKRQRTFESLKRIALRESLRQPVVIIFEDLHWIDSATQGLLDLTADSIANARVLILVNYRPEYRHEWGNKSYYSQLRLEPLDSAAASEMLTTLVGDNPELQALKRLIIERTEGNPFFIEEMLQVLFDEGVLTRNGVVKIARPFSQLRLPATVQGILAARIDRQPAEQKQLLQTLAVIGRESRLDLVRQIVSTTEQQLQRMLTELQASEFIHEQPAFPQAEYVFKHALTQEVAYNSMLLEQRKALHERVGRALESTFAGQLDDHIRELARHYSHSDNLKKAMEYLERAGRAALRKSLYEEATAHFRRALTTLGQAPDESRNKEFELSLQIGLGQCALVLKGFAAPEVERSYTRAETLCEQLGDRPELFSVLHALCYLRIVRGDADQAYASVQQLISVAERGNDQDLLLEAYPPLGEALFAKARFGEAMDVLERATALYDRDRHRHHANVYGVDPAVASLCWCAWSWWLLGFPYKGFEKIRQAVSIAHETHHFPSEIFALSYLAIIHQLVRHPRDSATAATKALDLAAEHGMTLWLGWTNLPLAWARGTSTKWEESNIRALCDAWQMFESTGANWSKTYFLACLAEAQATVGDSGKSLQSAEEGLAFASRTGEHFYQAELHRLKGEALALSLELNGAEMEFRRALDIARSQDAKSWELRAATSLARFLMRERRRDEALTLLAQIYNWFTEGFDTADLTDAKTLLDDLSD
jgi:Flp pilus assembly protein TadD